MHERKTRTDFVPDVKAMTRKKRVCAYARVSSDRDEAFHSLSAQIGYYQNKIAEHPDWEFVEVFSDRGITGTKENRHGFQAMLAACRNHEVDIVLAKSITRFARNTVILLETVRELKDLGIDIHFEEERIETLSAKGELMISILAARAQEEARSASENQKWRIKKSYEKGIPVTGNCLGYRMVDHQFLIDEEEEQIVLQIFSMYLSGMGKTAIANKLKRDGVKNRFGKCSWGPATIEKIIRNEKYCGDLRLQKTYTENYVTKKTLINRGEVRQYYISDAHDSIIDRETFQNTQEEIKRRAAAMKKSPRPQRSMFTGLIVCANCGVKYRHKIAAASTKYAKPVWICYTFDRYGKESCDAQQIPEDILIAKTCEVLGVQELNETILKDRIKAIVVADRFKLAYVFKEGSMVQVEWKHRSRRESWTPEMKEKARQITKARHELRKVKGENDHD